MKYARTHIHMTPAGRAACIFSMVVAAGGAIMGSPLLSSLACVFTLSLVFAYRQSTVKSMDLQSIQLKSLQWAGCDDAGRQIFTVDVIAGLNRSAISVGLSLHCDGFGTPVKKQITVPPCAEGQFSIVVEMPEAGQWHIRLIQLVWLDTIRMFQLRRDLFTRCSVTIRPRPLYSTGTVISSGRHRELNPNDSDRASELGTQGDCRELRPYQIGDSARTIAWRASAKFERLMVRQYERTDTPSIMLMLNTGPAMRWGPRGQSALDYARSMAQSLLAQHQHERIGLITFDHRIVDHLSPSGGPVNVHRIENALLDLTHPVAADLTEVSNAEVLAVVGRFLRDRLPWDNAPNAYIDSGYDLAAALNQETDVIALCDAMEIYREQQGMPRLDDLRKHTDMNHRARLFCRTERIKLPYRLSGPDLDSRQGFRDGMRHALKQAVDHVYVLDIHTSKDSSADFEKFKLAAASRGVSVNYVECQLQ
ncbi:MAG: DUF58 domain-containing protein [Myxococcota bacterium]|nr:DUF58 domain-containing protein [Myxococcota bacterium]